MAIVIPLDPTTLWIPTGQTLDGTEPLTIEYMSGTWTANPSTGLVDADGNPELIAKSGYNLPGKPEGLLVGRIEPTGGGADVIFAVGSSYTTATPTPGALSLSINDDMFGQYGAGFTDNQGLITVKITVG